MDGRQIRDEQWEQLEGFLPGRPGSVGVTAKDNRRFIDAVLWVLRIGAQWQDLPGEYSKWKTIHRRYNRWARSGIWKKVFQVLLDDQDRRYVMIGSTIVRTHLQVVCGKGGPRRRCGPVHRWAERQGASGDRCPGPTDAHCPDRRAGSRCAPGHTLAGRYRNWGGERRQGV